MKPKEASKNARGNRLTRPYVMVTACRQDSLSEAALSNPTTGAQSC